MIGIIQETDFQKGNDYSDGIVWDKQLKRSFVGCIPNGDVGNERVIINMGFG